MMDVVELIDELNGLLWPFITPRRRQRRLKKPLAQKLLERDRMLFDACADGGSDWSASSDVTADGVGGGGGVTAGAGGLEGVDGDRSAGSREEAGGGVTSHPARGTQRRRHGNDGKLCVGGVFRKGAQWWKE